MFDIDFSSYQWTILLVCAFIVGVSKTGIPGIGILAVPMLALAFPAKASTGLLLPMLAFADIFAVVYYRRYSHWNHILRLLPPALMGIIVGSIIIRHIDNSQLKPFIGIIVLTMLAINYWRNYKNGNNSHIPTHWSFALIMGFTAGLTTQLANAAGPIMVIYLLAMKLEKNEFIGTGAWYFLILNWLKIPLFIWDGRISLESISADILVLPLVAIGALSGILILKKLPQKVFNTVIQILALLAALKLVLSAFGI
jgi:uncharacterized membrane protein YfcA